MLILESGNKRKRLQAKQHSQFEASYNRNHSLNTRRLMFSTAPPLLPRRTLPVRVSPDNSAKTQEASVSYKEGHLLPALLQQKSWQKRTGRKSIRSTQLQYFTFRIHSQRATGLGSLTSRSLCDKRKWVTVGRRLRKTGFKFKEGHKGTLYLLNL